MQKFVYDIGSGFDGIMFRRLTLPSAFFSFPRSGFLLLSMGLLYSFSALTEPLLKQCDQIYLIAPPSTSDF